MALVTTKAIVLSSLKYSDSSLIVKCFTAKEGLKTYLVRGVLKAKKGGIKAAYFQPLSQLSIVANHNSKNTLNSIKEIQIAHSYKTIYLDVVKQAVVFFLSEVLSDAIQEEEQNSKLYNFLEKAFIWLDYHDKIANFHLLFLLNLSSFLGFYPDLSGIEKKGFDLQEGIFSDDTFQKQVISGNPYFQFKKLLGINFENLEKVSYTKRERQVVLHVVIRYYQLHLDSFKTPKSLAVLETVFS